MMALMSRVLTRPVRLPFYNSSLILSTAMMVFPLSCYVGWVGLWDL